MAGYSGTPLAKKLGLRPGLSVAMVGLPDDVGEALATALSDCERVPPASDSLEFTLVFARSRTQLERAAARAASALVDAGTFWAAWPKQSSGVSTDLKEDTVREVGLAVGLVDVKVCAISETWSGLKFVRRRKDRGAASRPGVSRRSARPR
jgi:hypothetical protein